MFAAERGQLGDPISESSRRDEESGEVGGFDFMVVSFILLGNPEGEQIGPLLRVNVDLNISVFGVFHVRGKVQGRSSSQCGQEEMLMGAGVEPALGGSQLQSGELRCTV